MDHKTNILDKTCPYPNCRATRPTPYTRKATCKVCGNTVRVNKYALDIINTKVVTEKDFLVFKLWGELSSMLWLTSKDYFKIDKLLKAKWGDRVKPRDVVWYMANHPEPYIKKAVAGTYGMQRQLSFQYLSNISEAKDEFYLAYYGELPDGGKNARHLELDAIAEGGSKSVQIHQSPCCDACKPLQGCIFSLKEEEAHQHLPNPLCTLPICRCVYVEPSSNANFVEATFQVEPPTKPPKRRSFFRRLF